MGCLCSSTSLFWLIISFALVHTSVVFVHSAGFTSFIFGDSLVDAGNNNYIPSTARANYRPHGIDYPGGIPTGRFGNGKIISDYVGEFYNSPPTKPYLDPSNDQASLMLGSNFASAGAGIFNSTGRIFVVLLTVEDQLELFQQYKQKMVGFIGEEATDNLVKGALYSITFGGNDYINNYLMPSSKANKIYTLQQWQDKLIATYKTQLAALYNLGARNVLVTGMGPLGCIPMQLNLRNSTDGSCIEALQQMAVNYNTALKPMLKELNAEFPDAVFAYVNVFDMNMQYINNPTAYGFEVPNRACCGQGRYGGSLVCARFSPVCPDRNKYTYWDPFHPSQKVHYLLAQRILTGPPSDISPMNVRQILGF